MSKPFYYTSYLFAQGEQATEFLDYIDEHGENRFIEYAIGDCGFEPGDDHKGEPWGSSDYVFQSGRWYLSYNTSLEYVSLCRKLTRTEQDQAGY